jgi:signal transduction histidine kinase
MSVSKLFGKLVEPPKSVEISNERTTARISLAFQLLLMLAFIIRDLMKFVGLVAVETLTGVSIAFLASYLIGRMYSPRWSTFFSLFLISFMSYSLIFSADPRTKQDVFGSLVWLSWSMILASYLLEIRWTAAFVFLNLGAVFLLPLIYPIIDMSMISSSFAFISGISAISLLGSWLLKKAGLALKAAQQESIQNERLAILGRMSGGIGHELRNPLGAMKNAVYYLQMVLGKEDKEIEESLQIIDNEIANSELTIQSLLDFTHPKAPARIKAKIGALLEDLVAGLVPIHDVEVELEVDSSIPIMLLDSNQISRAFANIVLNAIQAMPDGGVLSIAATLRGDGVVQVSFSDTGVGISEEHLSRLFEPLFTTKAKGMGLGLAISKLFIEAHKGTILVESQIGSGSTVTVKLPLPFVTEVAASQDRSIGRGQ